MNRGGLNLEISMNRNGLDNLGATYRDEGLSINADHLRLFSEEIQLEVGFADIIIGNLVGKGACSTVYSAKHKRSQEKYAVKLFSVYDGGQASQLYNEIRLLTSFECDALISLKGAFHDHGSIGIILEYMDRGSIEFMKEPDVLFPEAVLAGVAFQIIWGLAYLHYEKQIHRDVKPGNVLMNSNGHVKLSDFGISKELDSTTALSNTSVGSNPYMSPERLDGDRYDASSDIWSVGISLIELWRKKYPFEKAKASPIDLCGEIKRYRYDDWMPANKFSVSFRRFLQSMLLPNPADRATSYELTTAKWLEEQRVYSLTDAQHIIQDWLVQLDTVQLQQQQQQRRASAAAVAGAGGAKEHAIAPAGGLRGTLARGISAAEARDMCEMSLSMDARQFNNTMNNPFMSSGSLLGTGSTATNSTGRSSVNILNVSLQAAPKQYHTQHQPQHQQQPQYHQQQHQQQQRRVVVEMETDDNPYEYDDDFEEEVVEHIVEMKYDAKRSSHGGDGAVRNGRK